MLQPRRETRWAPTPLLCRAVPYAEQAQHGQVVKHRCLLLPSWSYVREKTLLFSPTQRTQQSSWLACCFTDLKEGKFRIDLSLPKMERIEWPALPNKKSPKEFWFFYTGLFFSSFCFVPSTQRLWNTHLLPQSSALHLEHRTCYYASTFMSS